MDGLDVPRWTMPPTSEPACTTTTPSCWTIMPARVAPGGTTSQNAGKAAWLGYGHIAVVAMRGAWEHPGGW